MHVAAEAGSVRACQLLRIENMQKTFGHPSAGLGCLIESKRQETHSKRLSVARLEGQSAWARIYPIEIHIYDEVRNRIRAKNGETEETTEVISSPLLVYIDLLALLYVLHA